ncbi:formylglycine-generating enzyme family protein [Salipiger mucosus]|uniref:Nitrite reductase accessory protein NirV n=1 Tax=Salipiger mucosus DSM 16094 TaxID=1123237 RepID=S9Q2U6_9RHOB|nr:SUMF1/EgtB/PvdO family nonheme iron enzyme [Salipiger mucosus]EPX75601.1 Nitrite reductase accessory protein NirV [Salipiger mucosus DSM 16094]
MKTILLVPLLAAVGALGLGAIPDGAPPFAPPQTVTVAAGEVSWRPLGNFSQEGKARTPRRVVLAVPGFEIMKHQVSRDQYSTCVAAGACAAVPAVGGSLPQTQVNWQDATAFAAWYSELTKQAWRLPTEAEWQLAAAERYGDAAADAGARDPGERMLSAYANGVFLRGSAGSAPRPAGGYGENSLGVADMGGNIWEWTDGCMVNGRLAADGTVVQSDPYCGVRIAGGRHRAAVIDFVRDASVGGCAVGLPPDHLGFRLVRDAGAPDRNGPAVW